MPGRPRKKRIRHPSEYDHAVSRVGRLIRCNRCWQPGHNKKTCSNPAIPKPTTFYGESSNTMNQEEQSNQDNSNAQPETFAEQMPVYSVDPVLPKKDNTSDKKKDIGSKRGSTSGTKKCMGPKKGNTSSNKKSWFADKSYMSPEVTYFIFCKNISKT